MAHGELYWIDAAPHGRLAIAPRPRGGDWLAEELRSWRDSGVEIVVSLLRDEELVELELASEQRNCEMLGLSHYSFSIQDRGVPASAVEFLALAEELHQHLRAGRAICIHCRMGIGRSSLLAAYLLAMAGLPLAAAWEAISRGRGMRVPDTADQVRWLEAQGDLLRSDA